MEANIEKRIREYLDAHWNQVVADIATLVAVESVEDLSAAAPGAPFGPGPRAALDQALAIARRMGLETHDCEGYVGYADLPGATGKQIGIIGHVDVVPAGPGWHFEPYAVTRKDGYLIGRGTSDDKGPLVVALHAVKFWLDQGSQLPYTVRVVFGANEETNMKDVEYYRARHDDPAFLFTPDAEFPVCYGEAGICSGHLESTPIDGRIIREISGGVAVNAVPGEAAAVLAVTPDALASAAASAGGCIQVESHPQGAFVHARGKSAHASTPELGQNAVDALAEFLLAAGVLTEPEQRFFELVRRVTSCTDGSGLGVSAADEHFGALTAVGGMLELADDRLRLSVDFRYPTSTSAARIARQAAETAQRFGATFVLEHDKEPFLMDPESPAVQALLRAYNDATGEDARPFTMKGGTYARMFDTGVSFGPEKPWQAKPSWVGSMHGPDEGISEQLLKQAFAIYVRTIGALMQLDL